MIAYKLVRKLKNGDLKSLFIDKAKPLEKNKWLHAKCVPTTGFAVREGWHCTLKPHAPHLSLNGRVWVKVEIENFEYYDRPESQGGTWVLAQKMKIVEEVYELAQ